MTNKIIESCKKEIACQKCNIRQLCEKRIRLLGTSETAFSGNTNQAYETLNRVYDKPIRTTKTEIYPNITSLTTEQTLSGVKSFDRTHHRTFPRVRRTYNMTKPNGWKSVWGIYRNRRTIGGHSWFDSNPNRQ